jgi:exopolysaccharide biosynthesis polyprenyl glycosylphosphotransferase
VLRWFLLLFCWSYLLLRVSRLGLNLLASHPDGSGGLENVHLEFLPMIIAFLSIVSASFAEELVAGTMVFGEMERILFVMIVVVIVMFVGPVTVFAPRLKSVRLKDEQAAGILNRSSDRVELIGVLTVGSYLPKGKEIAFLGHIGQVEDGLFREQPEMVLVRDWHLLIPELTPQLRRWRYQGIETVSLTDMCEMAYQAVPLQLVTEAWLFRASGQSGLLYIKKLKRLFDVVAALLFIVLLGPALLVGMLAVRLSSPGPIFFRQKRLGKMGKTFYILKLRTMHLDAEKDGPQWSKKEDPRVFAVGRWLRQFRVDEIPQLFNILSGQMSFVGPRPERPEFSEELERHVPYYQERLLLQPGLTGWAQVRYPYGSTMADAWRKQEHDLFYMKHMSILLDFFILLETVRTVLVGGVTDHRSRVEAMEAWKDLVAADEAPTADSGSPALAL